MRFWDSSALVPLSVAEPSSARMRSLLASDREVTVWWLTAVECRSALWRRRREGGLSQPAFERASTDVDELLASCETIQPVEAVRDRALRLLGVHALRGADALQLAAALASVRDKPTGVEFVCLDDRLRQAARTAGFRVLP